MSIFAKIFIFITIFTVGLGLKPYNVCAASWRINCQSTTCTASYLNMQLKWAKVGNSVFNGKLISIQGLPIDNEEFNVVIEKANSAFGLNIPKGDFLNEFIQWLGDIGYTYFKNNIDRYLASCEQTLRIYENNQTDDYICAFLAYKFPKDISKINFDVDEQNNVSQTLLFIKYLSMMDKSNNPQESLKAASKFYIYLLQKQNAKEFNEYYANYKNFVLSYTASLYYQSLMSNINAQLEAQRQKAIRISVAKKLPLFVGLIVLVWIAIVGYIIIDKKRKNV